MNLFLLNKNIYLYAILYCVFKKKMPFESSPPESSEPVLQEHGNVNRKRKREDEYRQENVVKIIVVNM